MEVLSNNFNFKIIWLKDNIGIAVDKKLKNGVLISITSFYFWPKQDSWKLLNYELSIKPWMTEMDKLFILNKITSLINFWKKENSNPSNLLNSFSDILLCGTD